MYVSTYVTHTLSLYRDSGICKTGTRVFIFDYGGALLHKERFDIYMKQTLSAIAGRRPSQTMMEAVQRLSADPLNAILVITGITRMKFGQTFKDLKNVAIATSNGLIYSWGDMLAMRQPNQHRNSCKYYYTMCIHVMCNTY